MEQTQGALWPFFFSRQSTEVQSVHLTGSDMSLFSLSRCHSLEVRGKPFWWSSLKILSESSQPPREGLAPPRALELGSFVHAQLHHPLCWYLEHHLDHISSLQPMSGWRPQGASSQLPLSFSQVMFQWNYIAGEAGALTCGTCQFLWCKCTHCGQFWATNMPSTCLQKSWKFNSWVLGPSTSHAHCLPSSLAPKAAAWHGLWLQSQWEHSPPLGQSLFPQRFLWHLSSCWLVYKMVMRIRETLVETACRKYFANATVCIFPFWFFDKQTYTASQD